MLKTSTRIAIVNGTKLQWGFILTKFEICVTPFLLLRFFYLNFSYGGGSGCEIVLIEFHCIFFHEIWN